MPIQMIQHADHMADSYMGDVRVVHRQGKWAMAVRSAGGEWHFTGTGPKAELVKLAVMALPHKYPGMYINS
jgi:hypothetical protein